MNTKKKMTIVIVALIVAIVVTMSAIVVVLVASNQSGNAIVSVKYESNDVSVTIWANCYIGTTTYNFLTEDGSASSISLSPDTQDTGQLFQPSSVTGLSLDRNNQVAVFEYIFRNDTNDIDISIDLTKIPGDDADGVNTGVTITYASSDTKISDFDNMSTSPNYSAVPLPANSTSNATKYVYVVVSITNLLYSAEFRGNFEWSLNRAN